MKKRVIVSLILMIMTVVCFTGCAGKDDEQMSACLVYSNRANCPLPNFNNDAVNEISEEVANTFGCISAICVDGNPEIVGSVTYEDIPENVKKAGSSKIKKDAIARIESFTNTITNCVANDSEADLLESLRLAVRSLSSNIETDNKSIVVMDSGLSTTGILNFQNNILQADSEKIAEDLSKKDAIPDFTNCKVIFINLGDTSEPQDKLSPQQTKHLKEIWQAIVEKGGGSFEEAESMPLNEKTKNKYPKVSNISIPEEQPIQYSENTSLDINAPIVIGEDQVKFVGDSDEYVDENNAMKTLKPISEYLKNNESISVLLIGTTAGDTNSDYTISLSNQRALAVRESLVELGVAKSRIKTKGMGCEDPWHISGAGTEGDMASQNRKVVLLDANSEIASQICQ